MLRLIIHTDTYLYSMVACYPMLCAMIYKWPTDTTTWPKFLTNIIMGYTTSSRYSLDRLIPIPHSIRSFYFIVRNKQLRLSKYCDISQIYMSKNALNIYSDCPPIPETIYRAYFITTMTHMFGMIFGSPNGSVSE